jgi:hypothetical protein
MAFRFSNAAHDRKPSLGRQLRLEPKVNIQIPRKHDMWTSQIRAKSQYLG